MEIKKANEVRTWSDLQLNKKMTEWCESIFESPQHAIYYGRAVAFCPVKHGYGLSSSVPDQEIRLALALDKAGFIHHFDVETLSAWLLFDRILDNGLDTHNELSKLDEKGIKFIFTPFVNSGFCYFPSFKFSCPDGIPWDKFNDCYERSPWTLNAARKTALYELAKEIGGKEIEVIGRHFGLFGYEKLELRYGFFGPKVKNFTEISKEIGESPERTKTFYRPKIMLNSFKNDKLIDVFRPNYDVFYLRRELEEYHDSLSFNRERELMRVLQLHFPDWYERELERTETNYFPELNQKKFLIRDLGLSRRVYNAVSSFYTVEGLMNNLEDLPRIHHLGLVGVAEIMDKLTEHGFIKKEG